MIKTVSREQCSIIDREQNYIHTEYYEKKLHYKNSKKKNNNLKR